jgi:hypothetical protein
MRERLDDAGGDDNVGIEEPREIDAVGLGDETQQITVAIEGSGVARLNEFEGWLVVAIDDPLAQEVPQTKKQPRK